MKVINITTENGKVVTHMLEMVTDLVELIKDTYAVFNPSAYRTNRGIMEYDVTARYFYGGSDNHSLIHDWLTADSIASLLLDGWVVSVNFHNNMSISEVLGSDVPETIWD